VKQDWLVLLRVKYFVTAMNIADLWLFSSGAGGDTHRQQSKMLRRTG